MGNNKTPNYGLNKPTKGTRNWDTYVNQNTDIIDTKLKSLTDKDASQDSRIDNIVAGAGTSNTEIVDARNSASGKTYTTLKARLDDVESYLQEKAYGVEWNFINDTYRRVGLASGLTQGAFNSLMPWAGMKRCNLADDGTTINAFYGDPTYIEDGSNGQVMVNIPEFWYKREFSPTTITTWISPNYTQGFKKHDAFFKGNTEVNKFFLSAFEGSIYDVSALAYLLADEQVANFTVGTGDKLCSIAGAKPASGLTQNLTIDNSRILANNRGSKWGQLDYTGMSAVQMLLFVEYAGYNSQLYIGQGVVNKASGTGNESEITGQTSSLGNNSGTASGTNGLVSISYRGIENFWGNIWSWVDGLNIQNGVPFVNLKNQNFASNKFIDEYISVGETLTASGYQKTLIMKENSSSGFLPKTNGGGTSTFISDYVYTNLSGSYVARLGGDWYNGAIAGAFCLILSSSAAYRYRDIGARLLCR